MLVPTGRAGHHRQHDKINGGRGTGRVLDGNGADSALADD